MKIAVTAETTIDLTPELLEKYDIHTIAPTILIGETEYQDGSITIQEIFDYADKNGVLPKTSAINPTQYKEFFTNILKDYDAIIHVSLSSEISSMCANAIHASNDMSNVYVVDSKSLSTGIALLSIKARVMANQNLTPKEIFVHLLDIVPKVQASFIIKKLDYLYKGGRCSALSYLGANIIQIRPQIMLKNGKMGVHKKYIGRMDRVIPNYCKDVLNEFSNPDLSVAFVTYTTATPEMIASAKSALQQKGFKEIYETTAGATIASHCGENTLGILFINQ